MSKTKHETALLNKTPCVGCGNLVDDRAPACPNCGKKIYIEHPGDITPTKHEQIAMNKKET